mmetsp:Transcript_10035/g.15178  ORF Transcript_10035/g.15178 Transcript_10035/m.15178 type:complete len:448 (+) Transcript_10035:55-1398(+)|eukprot:CAMPEP_0185031984 /NCGR_PEP_ID=MMETSP1103-20130426/19788_1 /TAXON_ID=36769 /ORGANISM="Paraphysomonas bandaiensis, Strain Caron Lab Isolate" /LENGTH=447 /DNA_ID=CAMNT_0027567709 /DNA_START=1 /DNA_END=1344 /DNA_ORIENTATION=+
MGIEFRGSYYKRDVSLGKRTVKDGEAVAVWNRLGVHRQVIGPALVRLFFSTINFLDKRIAGPNEYLVVVSVDGSVQHLRGPVTLFENPVFHRSVAVKSAYSLVSAAQYLVVNREVRESMTSKTGAIVERERIERVLIQGPNLYFPSVGETVVDFVWHGHSSQSDFTISPAVDKFSILVTSSRQWKVDAPFRVPTSSKLRGTVQLSFRFCIVDVNRMLDNSSDVIGDLYDAVTVDLANIGSRMGTQSDKREGPITTVDPSLFTDLEVFVNVLSRASAIGVLVDAVSYRGFEASKELKAYLTEMSDVQSRITRDRLLAEQEAQRIEADLSSRRDRLEQEQSLQQAQLAARRQSLEAEQEYAEAEMRHKLAQEEVRLEAEMGRMRQTNDEALRVLGGLQTLGVDLTTLLSARSSSSGTSPSHGLSSVARVPAIMELFAREAVPNNIADKL